MQPESPKTPSTKVSKPRKRTSKKTAKGLGDVIENLIPDAVKDVVEKIAGEDCGCSERKSWLNKRFPFFKTLSDSDKKTWENRLEPAMKKGKLQRGDQEQVIAIYHRTFGKMHRKSSCGSCVEKLMVELQKAYEASCES